DHKLRANAAQAATATPSKRLTKAQRDQLRKNVRDRIAQLHKTREHVVRGIVRREEKAKLLGRTVNPKLQAKWDAKQDRKIQAAKNRDAVKREADHVALRAKWAANNGPLWPSPLKLKVNAAPGVESGSTPTLERSR